MSKHKIKRSELAKGEVRGRMVIDFTVLVRPDEDVPVKLHQVFLAMKDTDGLASESQVLYLATARGALNTARNEVDSILRGDTENLTVAEVDAEEEE